MYTNIWALTSGKSLGGWGIPQAWVLNYVWVKTQSGKCAILEKKLCMGVSVCQIKFYECRGTNISKV